MRLLVVLLALAATAAAAPDLQPGILSGRVFDGETLRPVVTAFVTIESRGRGDLGTVGTDREGRFRLEDVPAGFHRLVAWRGAEGSDPLPELAVLPGEEVRNVLLVVRPRAVVKLRVETPSGRPPRDLRCVLERPPDIVEAVRRPTGSIELRAAPGTWTLHVSARGFRTHVETLELEEYDRRFISLELSTGVSVVGRIIDGDGSPIGGAVVERLRVDEPRTDGAAWTTEANGRYDLAGGAPTPTRFRVAALGYRPIVATLRLSRAGFILRHDFTLEKLPVAGAVAGRVVDPDGRPVAGAPVRLDVSRLPLGAEGRTDGDGRFRFEDLPESEYTVTLVDPEEAFAPEAAPAAAGGDPVRLVLRPRPRVTIRPHFIPDGGAPPLWRVRLESNAGETRTALGAGETPVELRLLGGEVWTLRLDTPGYDDPGPSTLRPKWNASYETAIPVPATLRTGTLALWLLTRDDLPIDVAHRVRVAHPGGETTVHGTDPLGGLILRRLGAGAYRIRALREGSEEDEGAPRLEVALESGEKTSRTIRADPALVVRRDVIPGGDRPLRVRDALTWAAGTRLEALSDLDEILEFFGDREIGIELVRDGETVKLRAPASSLKGYRFVEALR